MIRDDVQRRGTYKVVRKLQTRHVGIGILEVDHDELLVLVGSKQEGRLARRDEAQDVAVLRLRRCKQAAYADDSPGLTSLCAKMSLSLIWSTPSHCCSSHSRYRPTARLNTGHSTPHTNKLSEGWRGGWEWWG